MLGIGFGLTTTLVLSSRPAAPLALIRPTTTITPTTLIAGS